MKPSLKEIWKNRKQIMEGVTNSIIRDEFVEKIASGKSDFVTINLTDQKISITGNVAVVRHQLFATNNDNGKPGEVKLKILLVFKKVGKDWKLLARQAVKLT